LKQPRSCGFLVVTGSPVQSFLLMEHHDRWDLPKGHVDPGESDMEAALRELEEETGFEENELLIDPDFCYEQRYLVAGGRYGNAGKHLEKILRIFLATIDEARAPVVTEHIGYRWFPWAPPHNIQSRTIDPLLAQLHEHFQQTAKSGE
jgi:bis(5'-nucleosidyl)-tetraphosphatase